MPVAGLVNSLMPGAVWSNAVYTRSSPSGVQVGWAAFWIGWLSEVIWRYRCATGTLESSRYVQIWVLNGPTQTKATRRPSGDTEASLNC